MHMASTDDIPLRYQKLARLFPVFALLIGILLSYDQWWRNTYVPDNTNLWVCRLSDRSMVTPPRLAFGSSEYGICGSTIAAIGDQGENVYLWAYRGEEFGKAWQPTWIESSDPRISAFETTFPASANVGVGHYRVKLLLGKEPVDEFEFDLLDPRVLH